MNTFKYVILATLLAVTLNAHADSITFQYETSTGTISGTLLGTLQDDNDTFLVTQALQLSISLNTLDVSDFYIGQFSTLADDLVDGTPIDPSINNIGVVSLSGQTIDLTICDRELCVFGLVMSNGLANFTDIIYADLSADLNAVSEFGFDESNWSAQVPLPAAGWLFLGALIGLQRFSGRKTQAG